MKLGRFRMATIARLTGIVRHLPTRAIATRVLRTTKRTTANTNQTTVRFRALRALDTRPVIHTKVERMNVTTPRRVTVLAGGWCHSA